MMMFKNSDFSNAREKKMELRQAVIIYSVAIIEAKVSMIIDKLGITADDDPENAGIIETCQKEIKSLGDAIKEITRQGEELDKKTADQLFKELFMAGYNEGNREDEKDD